MTSEILSLLTSAANKYGIPPELAIAVAQQESGGNPNAVSPAGAVGVMQLMPATAAQLGVTDPTNPTQNINGGVQYLSQLLSEFNGDPQLALAAYNWGPGNVSKNGYSNWPTETQNYVSSIWSQVGDLFSTPAATTAAPELSADTIDESADDELVALDSGGISEGEMLAIVAGGGLIFWAVMQAVG